VAKRKQVRAAGGVVVRHGDGGPWVAVVHRPRYDDWSLPKGKLEPGEEFEQAALREIEEETGCRCRLRAELEPSRYRDQKGRDKLVRWFLMEPLEGEPTAGSFEPDHEVDELRWLDPDEASRLVDYPHDRLLLRRLTGGAYG
jgi:8-oxo-dGTP diphosphatase